MIYAHIAQSRAEVGVLQIRSACSARGIVLPTKPEPFTAKILACRPQNKRGVFKARMGIKFIENFETEVELEPSCKEDLDELLANPTFCKQVANETSQEHGVKLQYSGVVFQPVPWSPATQKGMPAKLEKYHDDPLYVTINVPPNFMFQAKIFKPSRLCAFYKRTV